MLTPKPAAAYSAIRTELYVMTQVTTLGPGCPRHPGQANHYEPTLLREHSQLDWTRPRAGTKSLGISDPVKSQVQADSSYSIDSYLYRWVDLRP